MRNLQVDFFAILIAIVIFTHTNGFISYSFGETSPTFLQKLSF
jgi:hypothetical protein